MVMLISKTDGPVYLLSEGIVFRFLQQPRERTGAWPSKRRTMCEHTNRLPFTIPAFAVVSTTFNRGSELGCDGLLEYEMKAIAGRIQAPIGRAAVNIGEMTAVPTATKIG